MSTESREIQASPQTSKILQELEDLKKNHATILKALQDGHTYREIAGRVQSTPDMISRYVHRYDLPARASGYPKGRSRLVDSHAADERLKTILDLRAKNLTLEQIAQEVGLSSKERVRQILHKAGQPSIRQEIAAERILIIDAIEEHIAAGMSIKKIADLLKPQEITFLDIIDILSACEKRYYEHYAERTKDPWPNLPDILAAMQRLRAAQARRQGIKQGRKVVQADRMAVVTKVLGAISPSELRDVAQKTGFHLATITTLAYGKRYPTRKTWNALAKIFPAIAATTFPE